MANALRKFPLYVLYCAMFYYVCRTLTGCVEYLEKRGDYSGAVELLELLLGQRVFGSSLRGHWLERLSLNLDFHLGDRHKVILAVHARRVLTTSTLD